MLVMLLNLNYVNFKTVGIHLSFPQYFGNPTCQMSGMYSRGHWGADVFKTLHTGARNFSHGSLNKHQ